MEDKNHLKPSRTGHTVIQDAPVEQHSHHHKRGILIGGVVMSMIIILGLYAASFRYRNLVPRDAGNLSRWGVIQEEFLQDSQSIFDGFKDITGTVTGVLNANKVRAKSIDALRAKIADSASGTEETITEDATSTPDTEEITENVPIAN